MEEKKIYIKDCEFIKKLPYDMELYSHEDFWDMEGEHDYTQYVIKSSDGIFRTIDAYDFDDYIEDPFYLGSLLFNMDDDEKMWEEEHSESLYDEGEVHLWILGYDVKEVEFAPWVLEALNGSK